MSFLLCISFVLLRQTSSKFFRCTNVLSQKFFFVFLVLLASAMQILLNIILKLYFAILVNRFLSCLQNFKNFAILKLLLVTFNFFKLFLVYLIFHLYIFQCAFFVILSFILLFRLRHNLFDIQTYYLINSSSSFLYYLLIITNILILLII